MSSHIWIFPNIWCFLRLKSSQKWYRSMIYVTVRVATFYEFLIYLIKKLLSILKSLPWTQCCMLCTIKKLWSLNQNIWYWVAWCCEIFLCRGIFSKVLWKLINYEDCNLSLLKVCIKMHIIMYNVIQKISQVVLQSCERAEYDSRSMLG